MLNQLPGVEDKYVSVRDVDGIDYYAKRHSVCFVERDENGNTIPTSKHTFITYTNIFSKLIDDITQKEGIFGVLDIILYTGYPILMLSYIFETISSSVIYDAYINFRTLISKIEKLKQSSTYKNIDFQIQLNNIKNSIIELQSIKESLKTMINRVNDVSQNLNVLPYAATKIALIGIGNNLEKRSNSLTECIEALQITKDTYFKAEQSIVSFQL